MTDVLVRCMHASMQFSDSSNQHLQDAESVFARAAARDVRWVTGTESGPGAGNLSAVLESAAHRHGYRFFTVPKTDSWLGIQKSFMSGGFAGHYHEVFPGKAHLHASRGILSAEFDTSRLGHITVGTAHLLTKGQQPGDPFYHQNTIYTVAIGAWAREAGKGRKLCFYGGDQNEQDSRTDTFRGQPLTSLWDELGKHESTGHGTIDVIASFNGDGRVTGHSIDALTDKEYPLFSDHFLVEGAFKIRPQEVR